MEIEFLEKAIEDLHYWRNSGNRNIQKRISLLLKSISETPFTGIGKPEPLKHELNGFWSRRVNQEHRIVYTIVGDKIKVISLRFHYS